MATLDDVRKAAESAPALRMRTPNTRIEPPTMPTFAGLEVLSHIAGAVDKANRGASKMSVLVAEADKARAAFERPLNAAIEASDRQRASVQTVVSNLDHLDAILNVGATIQSKLATNNGVTELCDDLRIERPELTDLEVIQEPRRHFLSHELRIPLNYNAQILDQLREMKEHSSDSADAGAVGLELLEELRREASAADRRNARRMWLTIMLMVASIVVTAVVTSVGGG